MKRTGTMVAVALALSLLAPRTSPRHSRQRKSLASGFWETDRGMLRTSFGRRLASLAGLSARTSSLNSGGLRGGLNGSQVSQRSWSISTST